jgi:hypothetical protein
LYCFDLWVGKQNQYQNQNPEVFLLISLYLSVFCPLYYNLCIATNCYLFTTIHLYCIIYMILVNYHCK